MKHRIAVIVLSVGVLAGPSCTQAKPKPLAKTSEQYFTEAVQESLLITEVSVTNIRRTADNSMAVGEFACKSQRGWTLLEGTFVCVLGKDLEKPTLNFVTFKPYFVDDHPFAGAVDPFGQDKEDETKTKIFRAAFLRAMHALEQLEAEQPSGK